MSTIDDIIANKDKLVCLGDLINEEGRLSLEATHFLCHFRSFSDIERTIISLIPDYAINQREKTPFLSQPNVFQLPEYLNSEFSSKKDIVTVITLFGNYQSVDFSSLKEYQSGIFYKFNIRGSVDIKGGNHPFFDNLFEKWNTFHDEDRISIDKTLIPTLYSEIVERNRNSK